MADVIDTGPWPGLVRTDSTNLYDTQQIAVISGKGYWTPSVINNAGVAGTITYIAQRGHYYIVGPICYVSCYVSWTSTGTATGIIINGLPIAKPLYSDFARGGGQNLLYQAYYRDNTTYYDNYVVNFHLEPYNNTANSCWLQDLAVGGHTPAGNVGSAGVKEINFSGWYPIIKLDSL